jgi:hypothetical protein
MSGMAQPSRDKGFSMPWVGGCDPAAPYGFGAAPDPWLEFYDELRVELQDFSALQRRS